MIDPRLNGKTVLITGANHGIGAAAARAFAYQRANLFLTYYRPPSPFSDAILALARREGKGGPELYTAMQQQSAEPLADELRSLGRRVAVREADLGEAVSIPDLFNQCEAEVGPVDVLVANHTYDVLETFDPDRVSDTGFPVSLVSAAEIDRHFTVNTRGCALLIREFVERFLKRKASWGRVITVSTDAAHAHTANVSYAASKHAIESYSRSAAAELGRYGITVNIVAPGPIQTGYITPEQELEIAAGTPLGRVGTPDDVAEVMVFLAAEQARWLTGQLLYVGGGWRMAQ